jgi:hypothetical protein
MNEMSQSPRTSHLAVVSLVLASLWYVGWSLALVFMVGSKDPQGWNGLPYVVWGVWGLPVAVLAALLAAWALWRIRKRPGHLTGNRLALTALPLGLLAWPVWYVTPMFVNLWR